MHFSKKLIPLALALTISTQAFAQTRKGDIFGIDNQCSKSYYHYINNLNREINHYEGTYKYYTGKNLQLEDGQEVTPNNGGAAALYFGTVAGCWVGLGLGAFMLHFATAGVSIPIALAACSAQFFLPIVAHKVKANDPAPQPAQDFHEDRQKKINEITQILREKIALKHDLMMVASWYGENGYSDWATNQKPINSRESAEAYKAKMLEGIKDSPRIGLSTPNVGYLKTLMIPFLKSGEGCANDRLMSADELKTKIIDTVLTERLEKGEAGQLKLEYSLPHNRITNNKLVDTQKCATELFREKVINDRNFSRLNKLTIRTAEIGQGRWYKYLSVKMTDRNEQSYSGWMFLATEGATCSTYLNWGVATAAIKITQDSTGGLVYRDDCAYDYKQDRSRDERCE